MKTDKLAFDKGSARTVDQDGRLHVSLSNISKACVNPYRGSEIPGAAEMGLDPDAVYQCFRDPQELKKGAHTFNNIPILDRHIPVSVDSPQKESVVGSTGTDAVFDEPYLRNSLVIWDSNSIAGIKTNQQRELSCAYRYVAVKESGVFDGVQYDIRMTEIQGNHVALVEVGRAGPDVIVGDSQLLENPKMKVGKLPANRKMLLAACLMASVRPLLAQDAKTEDLTAIAGSVDSLKTAKDKQALVNAVKKHYGDQIAQDADFAPLTAQLIALDSEEDPPKKPAVAEDDDDEDLDAEGNPKKKVAADGDDDDKIDKPAMDAAIAAAVQKTRTDTIKHMNAIHTATAEVKPLIGELAVAMDSAEDIYKLALDAAKVDVEGVHPSAYRAMVKMLPKAGDTVTPARVIAQDSASGKTAFDVIFPNASKMKGGV